jgi:hypothetical protein
MDLFWRCVKPGEDWLLPLLWLLLAVHFGRRLLVVLPKPCTAVVVFLSVCAAAAVLVTDSRIRVMCTRVSICTCVVSWDCASCMAGIESCMSRNGHGDL